MAGRGWHNRPSREMPEVREIEDEGFRLADARRRNGLDRCAGIALRPFRRRLARANRKQNYFHLGEKGSSFCRLLRGAESPRASVESRGSMSSRNKSAAAPPRREVENLLALHRQGKLRDVERKARKLVRRYPGAAILYELLGASLAGMDRMTDAVSCFRRLVEMQPGNAGAHYNLALTCHRSGQLQRAVEGYRRCLELDPANAVASGNLGLVLAATGALEDAMGHYRAALQADPSNDEIRFALARAYGGTGNLEDAEKEIRQAIGDGGATLEALLLLGDILQSQARLEEAGQAFRNALQIEPRSVEALCALADVQEMANRLDEAQETVSRALAENAASPHANLVQAILQRRGGDAQAAADTLSPFADTRTLPAKLRIRIHNELGLVYDRLRQSDMAFEQFTRANDVQAEHEGKGADKGMFLAELRNIRDTLTPDWVASWPDIAATGNTDPPAFMLGFPRSGTTLLDQILDAHPRIHVMEEPEIFMDMLPEIAPPPGRYPQALAGLDAGRIEAMRARYFELARQYAQGGPGGLLVEKNPLNILHLPLIARIFPDARIIHCLRHPCDVVLSSFMQHFAATPAMANFFRFDDTVNCYCEVMDLMRRCEQLLPLNLHTLRYEALLADFDAEIGALLAFLGIVWDDAVRAFPEHARGRHVTTASYQAVTEPLNTRAMYRWQRYERHFAPHMESLEPFVEAFGYAG